MRVVCLSHMGRMMPWEYHTQHDDTLHLVSLGHRAQRVQQDLHQAQVVVASSDVQTRVPHLETEQSSKSRLRIPSTGTFYQFETFDSVAHDIIEAQQGAHCIVGFWGTHVVFDFWCGSCEQQKASGLGVCILTGQVERCVSCLSQHHTVITE